ncbi:MAG TPA: hypothetical protein VM121_03200 [Acidimicrobiales bacterium]|nr:hypothetical protein [Acidimicrobiales bacterium]
MSEEQSLDERFEAELMELGAEIDAHFGGREASPAEVEHYLRERLLSEGLSETEAEQALARITGRD